MKCRQQIIFGVCASILVWGIFILADLIDEYVLDSGILIGAINITILPFVMLSFYIKNYLQRKPRTKEIVIWFMSYSVMYLILWYTVFYLENIDKFITQKHESGIIDINGIEYTLYGFSTLILFIILCVVFHVVHHTFARKNRQNNEKHSTIS